MPDRYKVCDVCRAKFSSPAGEADQLLTKANRDAACISCSAPILILNGEAQLYCSSCLSSVFRDYLKHVR